MRITRRQKSAGRHKVHPESYEAVEKLFAKFKYEDIAGGKLAGVSSIKDYKKLAEELG